MKLLYFKSSNYNQWEMSDKRIICNSKKMVYSKKLDYILETFRFYFLPGLSKFWKIAKGEYCE